LLAHRPTSSSCADEFTASCQNPKRANPALFAVPVAVILATLSLLHAYWALGGRMGRDYVVPVVQGKRRFNLLTLVTVLTLLTLLTKVLRVS